MHFSLLCYLVLAFMSRHKIISRVLNNSLNQINIESSHTLCHRVTHLYKWSYIKFMHESSFRRLKWGVPFSEIPQFISTHHFSYIPSPHSYLPCVSPIHIFFIISHAYRIEVWAICLSELVDWVIKSIHGVLFTEFGQRKRVNLHTVKIVRRSSITYT